MSATKNKENRIRVNVLRASAELQARMANSERPGLDAMHLMELGLVMEKMLKSGGLGNQLSSAVAVTAMPAAVTADAPRNAAPPVSPVTATKTGANLAEDLGWSPDTFTPPGL